MSKPVGQTSRDRRCQRRGRTSPGALGVPRSRPCHPKRRILPHRLKALPGPAWNRGFRGLLWSASLLPSRRSARAPFFATPKCLRHWKPICSRSFWRIACRGRLFASGCPGVPPAKRFILSLSAFRSFLTSAAIPRPSSSSARTPARIAWRRRGRASTARTLPPLSRPNSGARPVQTGSLDTAGLSFQG